MSEETVVLTLEDFSKRERPIIHRKSYYFRVEEYTLDGAYIRTYSSSNEASDVCGIARTTVSNCVKGKQLFVSKIDRIFLKEGDDINERLEAIDNFQLSSERKPDKIPIREYDLKGNLIMVYPSFCLASDLVHISISILRNIDKGIRLCTNDGRIFLREGNNIKARLELIRQRNYNECLNKSIDMYSLKGNPNGHFRNAAEAAEKFNISILSIIDCCLGITNTCKCNIFLFSGEDVKERLKLIKRNNYV